MLMQNSKSWREANRERKRKNAFLRPFSSREIQTSEFCFENLLASKRFDEFFVGT